MVLHFKVHIRVNSKLYKLAVLTMLGGPTRIKGLHASRHSDSGCLIYLVVGYNDPSHSSP